MRYTVRDPKTGKFITTERINWSEVRIMTTIDNETQADITPEIPTNLPTINTGDDEVTIRSTLNKFADGIVKLSSYAKAIDEANEKYNQLLGTLTEANNRVFQAEQAAAEAQSRATMSDADARMAREAYGVVAKERDDLATQVVDRECKLIDIRAELDIERDRVTVLRDNLRVAEDQLGFAREERDRYRETVGSLEVALEDAEFHRRERVQVLEATNADLVKELQGLHHKCNGLEDDNHRMGEQITRLQAKLTDVRNFLS